MTISKILALGGVVLPLVLFDVPSRAEEAAPPPKALSIGSQGSLSFGATVQTWFFYQKEDSKSAFNQFRIRRTEFKTKGELLAKKLAFEVMIDPAQVIEQKEDVGASFTGKDADGNKKTVTVTGKDSDGNDLKASATVSVPKGRFSVLQDAAITFKHDWCEFSIGQFKIPVSYEGYGSSSKLVLPERALVSKGLGDKRDIGIRFAKTFEMFGYALGVFNGSGQNAKDADDAKDVGLRLEGYPIGGLTVAAVYYQTLGNSKEKNGKQRIEGDVRLEKGPVLALAEYIMGTDKEKDKGDVKPRGFYGLIGYTIGGFQPVIRVGQFDANTDSKTSKKADGTEYKNASTHIEGGVNYYIPALKTHEGKVQLAVSQFSAGSGPTADKDGGKELQVITAFQVAF